MQTILIIGAGFSGAVTASQLLRRAGSRKLRVILLNRSGLMARGLAYGTHSPHHVLNVPAGNMSALHSEPDHFLKFARERDPDIGPSSFVARQLYGDYLEYVLDDASRSAGAGATLDRVTGEVSALVYSDDRQAAQVTLDDGQSFSVDKVVLAFGHFAAGRPSVEDPGFYDSEQFIGDPWNAQAIDAIDTDASVLLLGSGLTAIDIAATLLSSGGTRTVHVLSRHGLLPKAHRSNHVPLPPQALAQQLLEHAADLPAMLRLFRSYVRETTALGGDWREALNALRPATATLWQAMSHKNRRRFLRHVQPFWDNHRHRAAPSTHRWFEQAVEQGNVRVHAGRILGYACSGGDVVVRVRPRGATAVQELRVNHVINCIGPNSDVSKVHNPLIRQLLADGILRRDALGLGLEVGPDLALVDAQGQSSPCIFYVGPLLKAMHWEATAVPELRKFAEQLAVQLLAPIPDCAD